MGQLEKNKASKEEDNKRKWKHRKVVEKNNLNYLEANPDPRDSPQ